MGFKEMNIEKSKDMSAGFAISSIITSILAILPAAFTVISSTVGLIKASQAESGEIKTKDFTSKWENKNNGNIGYNVGFHYCI
ncbi:hypothetical protein [Mycoplasma struthionis]|uniref:Uncharacterized protein n=1 Tax=Mycoplasma struthionis TaxID=538220 RepID=A0A3G8LGF0_9MOLU|nr:hypothetical protein [Mycoplasma struthionis]AZG68726.1 hypothetical protein EGN60_01995 [Mycoplasma struthionis]TPI01845.1 hypothetical protein FJM01_01865 [Mycoplasma struthionis]